MASPKCLACLKNGLVGQMYKIAGKPYFKCHDCKRVASIETFQDIEFKWDTETKAWREWLEVAKLKGISA